MARIVVKCFPAPGFDGVFRAGRKWAASGTTVDTVEAEGDIEVSAENPVLQVGTKTLKAIEADGRFSFGIAGTIEEIEAIRAERDALKAENDALKAENAELKAQLEAATSHTGKHKK